MEGGKMTECNGVHKSINELFNCSDCDQILEYGKYAADTIKEIKKSIVTESVSYLEIATLQSLSDYIDQNDVLLLQWAGIPEN